MNIPVPIGPSDWRICKYALNALKILAADNWRMDIFDYLPITFIYIVRMLVPVMRGGFEVDHITAILLPCENMGQGCLIPYLKSL